MTHPPLSENYIADYVAKWVLPPPGSVFQVMGTKKIGGDSTNLKYRLCLSDGIHRFSQAMIYLADADSPVPPEYSIIRMTEGGDLPANTMFKMSNKLIWVVKNFEVLASDLTERIGNPSNFDMSSVSSNQEAAETPTPATPSPSSRGSAGCGSAPPAVPSKRSHDTSEREDDRSKLPRRALFTDTGASASAAAASSDLRATHTIAGLNPFNNKYTIKARVVRKSELRSYTNSRGSGHVFDVILQDASGDIKAACFNDVAVKFSQIFQENKVYYVSQAKVKPKNPNFNTTKHQYELNLFNDTVAIEVRESNSQDVPGVHYDYIQISDIAHKNEKDEVDVIGICSSIDDIRDITSKNNGRQFKKRDIQLTDTTDSQISVTVWGQKAEEFGGDDVVGKVVRIRGAKVSDFNGKSLSVSFTSTIEVGPNCPEANVLLEWWDRRSATHQNGNGSLNNLTRSSNGISASSISDYSTLQEIQSAFREVSASDPARFHKFEAYVVDIKADNVMYQACPNCNKKVVDLTNGTFRCEKCSVTKIEFSWRYIMRAAIADTTEYQWVTLFDDSAQKLVGLSAKELRALFDRDPEEFRRKLHSVRYTLFEFVAKTKCESYNDENRMKMNIFNVTPIVNHAAKERMDRLKAEIQKLKNELNVT